MFKPLTRAKTLQRANAGFAETQFLHTAGEADYSGFAPTEMFEDDAVVPARPLAAAAHEAASTSRSALERAASAEAPTLVSAPAEEADPAIPQSWVTSQWVAAQEAKAHEAANQARAVIAAQRRAEDAPAPARLTGLRAWLERLLPGDFRSLLPLFIGVTVTVALISAVLPLIDKP